MQGLNKCLMRLGQANEVPFCTFLLDPGLSTAIQLKGAWNFC